MKKILLALALVLVLVLGCAVVASADTPIVAWGDEASITNWDGHAVTFLGWKYPNAVEPTCTTYGIAYYSCNDPAHQNGLHAITIGLKPHNWIEDKSAYVAPTCTEPGSGRWICSVCGKIGDPFTILPNGHSFSNKYDVIFGATCTKVGYGVIVCDVCGTRFGPAPATYAEAAAASYTWNADLGIYLNADKGWVLLQKIAHPYTDWTYTLLPNCYHGGDATRTCIVCGDVQYVDEWTTLYADANGNIVPAGTKGAELLRKLAGVEPINNKYIDAYNALDGKTFEDRASLQKAIDEQLKIADLVLDSEEEFDCYNRILTYKCPHCGSKYGADQFGNWFCPHPAITVWLLEPTHVWYDWPENYIWSPYTWLSEYFADHPANSDVNEYVRCLALEKEKSIFATCEMPGIDLYKCKYFDHGGRHGEYLEDGSKDGFKTVLVPAKGHTWSEWVTVETYTKDGKNYKVQGHTCKVCGKQEHETIEYDPTVNYKQGLVQVGDDWAYFVDDKVADYTGFVTFEGGEFFVVKGIVAKELNGLVNCPGDTWYFLANGQIQRVDGFAEYAGEWFMIKNGELDATANGLYDYNGGVFAFAAGRLLTTVDGLWQNPIDNEWYFLSQGQVQKVTQEVTYNGETFNVVDGKLAE